MTFKSKGVMGAMGLVALFVSLGVMSFLSLRNAPLPAMLIILVVEALVTSLIGWIVGATDYTIRGELLLVRSGPFHWEIGIRSIESVRPSFDPSSSPALSLDRLKIMYAGGREILVSPKDRDGFVRALREVNPAIVSS